MPRPKALIYDPYLATLGGGERYMFAVAETIRGSFATPSMAAMRPLVMAGPMGRASMAPNVEESILTWASRTQQKEAVRRRSADFVIRARCYCLAGSFFSSLGFSGIWKRVSSIGAFTSIFSTVMSIMGLPFTF